MRRAASRKPAEQAFALRERFGDSVVAVNPARMTWTGMLQPTPLSCEYTVRITYRAGTFPRVKVVPQLRSRPGEPLPHFYREGLLCLHKENEWSPDMLIADTIVAWASEWLIHYEIWLATGDWHGGGENPTADGDGGGAAVSPARSRAVRRAQRHRRH